MKRKKGPKMDEERERATELEYLTWFAQNADFGPASSDVRNKMQEYFMLETGKNIPEGWNFYGDGETTTDNFGIEEAENE
jgi:hypothetical protein